MGNEVVKPYKIITMGEVVSSVVTGSLLDNFLLLENKGVTASHRHTLCVVWAAASHRGQTLPSMPTQPGDQKTFYTKQKAPHQHVKLSQQPSSRLSCRKGLIICSTGVKVLQEE